GARGVRGELSGCTDGSPCVATARDLDSDGVDEVLLAHAGGGALMVFARSGEDWVQIGSYVSVLPCGEAADRGSAAEAVRRDSLTPSPARWPDLMIDERRATFQPDRDCAAVLPAATAEPAEP